MSVVHWAPAGDSGTNDILVARAFGTDMHDLAVDFRAPLNIAIGALLASCLSRADGTAFAGDEVSGWTIAKRRQGLLAVAAATGGPIRTITATCAAPACGERVDLAVELADLCQDWRHEHTRATLPQGQNLELRCPKPADLDQVAAIADEADAAAALAQILVTGPPPRAPGWQQAVEAALSEADPLADLELRSSCPECGAEVAQPLVLEAFLMAGLAAASTRLMDEIHVLALAYHWSEPEILALPETRRHHYLSRIQEAWAA